MGKWKRAALNMMQLRAEYENSRVTEYRSVHKTLIDRALPLLYKYMPEAEQVLTKHFDVLIDMACAPDRDGDYEKGMGMHYYCGANSFGFRLKTSGGYYKNGIAQFSRSARTMLEEDLTMALTLWKAGFTEQATAHLARAVHMVSDICCLPHSTRMTYFSLKRHIHQSYESLAKWMYPDAVPVQEINEEALHIFDDRASLGEPLNSIVEAEVPEIPLLLGDPVPPIINRLHTAERTVAALLFRFCCDLESEPVKANYITDDMSFDIFGDGVPAKIRVTEKGIVFHRNDEICTFNFGSKLTETVFRAAHRRDGCFTFSPVGDTKGRVLAAGGTKLRSFSPHRDELLFSASL